MESELLTHLGFSADYKHMALHIGIGDLGYMNPLTEIWTAPDLKHPRVDYKYAMNKYDAIELETDHEQMLCEDYGSIVFLENIPVNRAYFWNMKLNNGKTVNSIDILLHGIETIAATEHSCCPDEMYSMFNTIGNGEYRRLLETTFGEERVQTEIDTFLDNDFTPRYSGSIGVTRLIRAMELTNLV